MPQSNALSATGLPHDHEAEVAVLATLLHEPKKCAEVLAIVSPDDFHLPRHEIVATAITALWMSHNTTDIVLVKSFLEDRGLLEHAGGVEGLVEIAEAFTGSAAVEHLAQTVRDKAQLRALLGAVDNIRDDVAANAGEAESVLNRAAEAVFAVQRQRDDRAVRAVGHGITDLLARLERGEPAAPGQPTGFVGLDVLLAGGLKRGDLAILAARPSIGKTSLALQIALNAAVERNAPVLFMSLEMSGDQLRQRALSVLSGIGGERLTGGEVFSGKALRQLRDAGDRLRAAPLFIDDTRGLTIDQVRARARRELARINYDLLVLDYLGLVIAPGHENRVQEVSCISRELKALAGELEVPVVCLSQLSRASEQRADKRPQLADLRDSGSIEQDADVVMLLHRAGFYEQDGDDGRAELIVGKNRNGPTGCVHMHFDRPTTSFSE